MISWANLPSNPCTLHAIGSRYTFVSRNQVAIAAKLVLIKAYPFALVLISVRVLIPSPLLLIIHEKVKESLLSS